MSVESKSILLTGGSGFLGRAIVKSVSGTAKLLHTLGRSDENDIICDLATYVPHLEEEYDVVIHNAGKAHVNPRTKKEKDEFFRVNVGGTRNLLTAFERGPAKPGAFVFISSVAVYGKQKGELISESEPSMAVDPYGKSKIAAEEMLQEWCSRNGTQLLILRPPLIAGRKPPGNLKTMIDGIQRGYYRRVGNGSGRRSMIMAEDLADLLRKACGSSGVYNLTDGHHPSFKELEELISRQLSVPAPKKLPLPVARLAGYAGDVINAVLPGRFPVTTSAIDKITSTLTFDDSKARANLGWKPTQVLDALRLN